MTYPGGMENGLDSLMDILEGLLITFYCNVTSFLSYLQILQQSLGHYVKGQFGDYLTSKFLVFQIKSGHKRVLLWAFQIAEKNPQDKCFLVGHQLYEPPSVRPSSCPKSLHFSVPPSPCAFLMLPQYMALCVCLYVTLRYVKENLEHF